MTNRICEEVEYPIPKRIVCLQVAMALCGQSNSWVDHLNSLKQNNHKYNYLKVVQNVTVLPLYFEVKFRNLLDPIEPVSEVIVQS